MPFSDVWWFLTTVSYLRDRHSKLDRKLPLCDWGSLSVELLLWRSGEPTIYLKEPSPLCPLPLHGDFSSWVDQLSGEEASGKCQPVGILPSWGELQSVRLNLFSLLSLLLWLSTQFESHPFLSSCKRCVWGGGGEVLHRWSPGCKMRKGSGLLLSAPQLSAPCLALAVHKKRN